MTNDEIRRNDEIRMKRLWVQILLALLLAGCAHYPVNAPLTHAAPETGYRVTNLSHTNNSDSLFVVLAFSGGGTRAAALSYGVLEELARTRLVWEGKSVRLLDEVDLISSVSGGSFTAAYYGLFGDRIFSDFRARFLEADIQGALLQSLFNPLKWVRSASSYFSRLDPAAEYYDKAIFAGKSFDTLAQ